MFESTDIDRNSFRNGTMRGIKRTFRTNGKCLGHRKGVNSSELLGYIDARKEIYVPSYYWVLENKCQEQIKRIRFMSQAKPVILLDYDTNDDIKNPTKPLSHASLIKKYIEEHQ